jgi:hypothetical protein
MSKGERRLMREQDRDCSISYDGAAYTSNSGCMALASDIRSVWTDFCSTHFSKPAALVSSSTRFTPRSVRLLTLSSYLAGCTMWKRSDCTGEGSVRINEPFDAHPDTCFSFAYTIRSVSCDYAYFKCPWKKWTASAHVSSQRTLNSIVGSTILRGGRHCQEGALKAWILFEHIYDSILARETCCYHELLLKQ